MKTLSVVMVILLFSMPFLALAQQTSDAAQAIADAQRDAKLINASIWGAAGCFLSFAGVFLASVATPPVPAEKLIGKSPEYVVMYTTTYQQTVKSKQTKIAIAGCVVGTSVVLFFGELISDSGLIF